LGEHGAARCIQMAGEHIERIHQPTGQRAEGLRAGANAAINGGAFGVGQFTRQFNNGVCRHAATRRYRRRREGGHCLLHRFNAMDPVGHRAQSHPLVGKQGVDHGRQQKHVGAGTNEVVRIGHGGGLGAPGVNHHQAATAGLQGFGFAAKVGHGPHAAIAGQRVGADHQQQLRARDVGQRHRHPVAKHQAAGQLFGHLVQAGR